MTTPCTTKPFRDLIWILIRDLQIWVNVIVDIIIAKSNWTASVTLTM